MGVNYTRKRGVNLDGISTPSTDTEPGCPRNVTQVVEITDHDRFVASDSVAEQLDENVLWQYRRSLAYKLSLNQDLVETDSTIEVFWNNQGWDEIKLALILHQVTLLDSINKSYLGAMTVHYDSISDIRVLISYNDSLLFTGLSDEDSTRILEENATYLSQLDSMYQIVDSLKLIASQKLDSCRSAVLEEYVEFEALTEYGAIESDIWRLMLTYGFSGSNLPNDDDSALITDYANLCMSEYGSAISVIRSLYYSLTNELITDDDVCGSEERFRNTKDVQDEIITMNLIPNPTRNFVTIKLNQAVGDACQITITSLNGECVKSVRFMGEEVVVWIENLNSGMYFVHLHCGETDLYRKLVIIK